MVHLIHGIHGVRWRPISKLNLAHKRHTKFMKGPTVKYFIAIPDIKVMNEVKRILEKSIFKVPDTGKGVPRILETYL